MRRRNRKKRFCSRLQSLQQKFHVFLLALKNNQKRFVRFPQNRLGWFGQLRPDGVGDSFRFCSEKYFRFQWCFTGQKCLRICFEGFTYIKEDTCLKASLKNAVLVNYYSVDFMFVYTPLNNYEKSPCELSLTRWTCEFLSHYFLSEPSFCWTPSQNVTGLLQNIIF